MSELNLPAFIRSLGVSARPGTLIEGSTARKLHVSAGLHIAPHHVVAFRLGDIFENLLGAGYYALVIFSDGKAIFSGEQPNTPPPLAEVMERMLEILIALNKRLHNGGHWLMAWHRDQRMSVIWRNADGIAVLEYGVDEPWVRVSSWPVDHFVKMAAQAMQEAGVLIRDTGSATLYTPLAAQFGPKTKLRRWFGK